MKVPNHPAASTAAGSTPGPPRGAGPAPGGVTIGDWLLLLAIVTTGALPFLGAPMGWRTESWELGVGVVAILFASGAALHELLASRDARSARSTP